MKRYVILISGRGSNMEALLDAGLPGVCAAVISNRADAAGLDFAASRGIATAVIDHRAFASREAFDAVLAAAIDRHAPDLVLLSGFMRILSEGFVRHYEGRLLNIHPSLLPAFPGLQSWRQALEAGATEAGCTVHVVDDGMDTGPILLQESVPIVPGDTAESLHARIQVVEHRLYPAAIRLMITYN